MKIWRNFTASLAVPLALIVVMVFRLGGTFQRHSLSPDSIAQTISDRPVEARLSGGYLYAPCKPPLDSADLIPEPVCSAGSQPAILDAISSITVDRRYRGAVEQQTSAKVLHSLGLLALVSHRFESRLDRAVDLLDRASDQADGNRAQLLSDLAAAYYTRAQRRDDPFDLLRALGAAEQAVEAEPLLPEARFNHALVLESLALRQTAIDAWQAYLEIDAGPWAGEAKRHLEDLESPLGEDLWPEARARLEEAALHHDSLKVAEIVGRFRQSTRLYAEEELLGRWARARAESRPSDAARDLEIAREIGKALAKDTGDQMLVDTVGAVDAALDTPLRPERLQRLEGGHRLYAEGLELIAERRFQDATTPLGEAAHLLDEIGSPFAAWARFQLLRCAYQSANYDDVIAFSHSILKSAKGRGYPNLVGRTWWVLGVSLMILTRPTEALHAYHSALAAFESTHEKRHALAMRTLLADAYKFLGDKSTSWRYRYQALRQLLELRDARRVRLTLSEAASSALEHGELSAALAFQAEVIRNTEASEPPNVVAAAFRERADILRRLGRYEHALEDISEADRLAEKIPDTNVKLAVRGDILLVDGAIRQEVDLSDAVASFDAAIEIFRDTHYVVLLAEALHKRAQVFRKLNEHKRAEDDLREAIELLERQRYRIGDGKQRISFLDRNLAVYDDMIAFQIDDESDHEEALGFAERARSRYLLDWIQKLEDARNSPALSPRSATLSAETIQQRIQQGVTVLRYTVLPDRLLIWVADSEHLTFREINIASDSLLVMVERLTVALATSRRSEEIRHASAEAFDIIVRPVAAMLPGHSHATLVFVPDKILNRIPFSALWNRDRQRFLIEDWSIEIAPSLSSLFVTTERETGDFRNANVLVVANPEFDREIFPTLFRLPYADVEARHIRSSYPEADILAGAAATNATLRGEVRNRRIVHIAAHAFANDENPFLSYLVLAPELYRPSSGVLYAREIVDLDLTSTRLVFLAACDSGKSNTLSSEGLAGLVWPFLAMGVPNVIASLWQVQDEGTSQLVDSFYRELSSGLEPAAALRRAKVMMIKGGDDNQVATWATFEIYRGAIVPGSE